MSETARKRPASSWDYDRVLKRELPEGRRPYILARQALANQTRHGSFDPEEAAREAILDLAFANMEGTLEPPLSGQLTAELNSFVEDYDAGTRKMAGPAVELLLSWAIDDGTKPLN